MADPPRLGDGLAANARGLDEGYRRSIEAAVSHLEASGVPAAARAEGAFAADFALATPGGGVIALSDLLARGPVVLSFQRGEWCSFCRLELEALLCAAPGFGQRGAQLLLLSPEAPSEALVARVAALGCARVVRDPLGGVALGWGLLLRMPDPMRQALAAMRFDLGAFYGTDAWLLPIPATYVIAPDGRIVLAHADPDFRRRLEPAVVIAALDRLAAARLEPAASLI